MSLPTVVCLSGDLLLPHVQALCPLGNHLTSDIDAGVFEDIQHSHRRMVIKHQNALFACVSYFGTPVAPLIPKNRGTGALAPVD